MSATVLPPLQRPLKLLYREEEDNLKVNRITRFDASSGIRKICKLGSGCHSNVYLVTTASRQLFALKCVDQNKVPNQNILDCLTSDLIGEARTLADLDHENVIKVHGVSLTPAEAMDADPGTCDHEFGNCGYFFLMDVLSETLSDRVQRWSKDKSSYKGIRNSILGNRLRKLNLKKMIGRIETVAAGVANGMAYVHSKGIVMQDLKPANIGFDMQTGQVRIFDFDMARYVLDLSMNMRTEVCGTPRYMAPEIMKGETPTVASDVYSFGCVLYTLCSLKVPFRGFTVSTDKDLEQFQAWVISGERPSLKCIPTLAIRNLIQECWAPDPLDRPTFNEIVEYRLPAITTNIKRPTRRTNSGSLNGSLSSSLKKKPSIRRFDDSVSLNGSISSVLKRPIKGAKSNESLQTSYRSDFSGLDKSIMIAW